MSEQNWKNQYPLHAAAEDGDLESVQKLVRSGNDVNLVGPNGRTPLHVAANRGYVEVGKFLLDHGADIHARSSDGETPLHIAVSFSWGSILNPDMVQLLINHGADIEVQEGYNGWTPLYSSVICSDAIAIVKVLLDNGAFVDGRTTFKDTPLHRATRQGDVDIVKLLLERGADTTIKNSDNETALHVAKAGEITEAIELLTQFSSANNEPTNSDHGTAQPRPTDGPIENGYRQMARDLVNQYGQLKRVEYLSHFPKFEICFEFENKTVHSGRRRDQHDIHFLSLGYVGEGPRYGRVFLDELGFPMSVDEIEAIKPGALIELRDGKVVVSYPGKVLPAEPEVVSGVMLEEDLTFLTAIIDESPEKVSALIARGDDLQATDNDGATPLHYAAHFAQAEIARILIRNGAQVDAKNAKGQTPLHEVVGHLHGDGDEATIEALLDGGASLNARDNQDATPLHSAATGGHYEAAGILLDRGAEIQALAQQLTPLHFSAYAGKPEVTRLLIDRGADVFAEKNGMNPLYMAKQPSHSTEAGKRSVIEMLEDATARARLGQSNYSGQKNKPSNEQVSSPSRITVGHCKKCGKELKVKKTGIKATMHLTCKCGTRTDIEMDIGTKEEASRRWWEFWK